MTESSPIFIVQVCSSTCLAIPQGVGSSVGVIFVLIILGVGRMVGKIVGEGLIIVVRGFSI